jgi:hypothetical protein
VVGRWYCVELRKELWSDYVELWVNGQQALDFGGTMLRYDDLYGRTISTVRFGLAETYGVGSSTVYADCCIIDNNPIGPE